MPAPFVWSTPAVTSQTQEIEDSSQDGEHRLEFFTTECLYYQHQEMCTLQLLVNVSSDTGIKDNE